MRAREKRTASAERVVGRLRRRLARGQATVEYSLVAHFVLGVGATGLMFFMPRLFDALNAYLNSIYWVIQSGAI